MKTEQDSSKLVIETVQVSAQGCYTCVAKNEFGEHKCSFCLAVVKDPYYVMYLDYVKSPYYKFVRDIMSYFLLLGLHFALCLEPATKEMSELEWAIFVLFLGRYLVERKQIRQQRSTYFGDTWNMLDLTSLLVYLLIFLLRITAWVMPGSWAASKVVLALAGYLYAFNTLCLTFRTFCHLMLQSKTIGIIQIAFFDTIKVITLVIAQCLAVLLAFTIALTKVSMDDKSLLGKGTEGKGIHTLWSMFKHLTWSILGKSDEFEREEFVEPMSHIVSQLFLVAFYVIAIILLLNMLIALLTSTYEKIQKNSFLNWSFERAITIQTYEVYDPIPVPLNIIYNAGKLLWCLVRILRYKCRSPEKKQIVGFEHSSFFQYVKKKYDEKYGNLFPAKDPLLEEAERNRQMTSQIIRTTFPQQGYCGGPQDWESHERVRIEGVHLTCEGEDPSWYDFGGARYRTAFSAQSRDFEVIVLETGKKELGIGVVWEGYKLCRTPGIYNNSLGYHTKVGIIYHNDDDGRNTEGPVMARRGDLIRCTMINEEKISGEVSFLFTINGRKISVEEEHVEQFTLKKSKGPLYPYVSMSEGCIVLARML